MNKEELNELKQQAAERICEDYGGCVDDFGELGVKLKNNDIIVNKITYKDGKFHYYTRNWVYDKPIYRELFPHDDEEYKILDEFYAWY